jgi:hypothetical protein
MVCMLRLILTLATDVHMIEKDPKITSMRISADVTKQAKIAASLRGITVLDYVREAVLAAADRDIEKFRGSGAPTPAKSRRSKGG